MSKDAKFIARPKVRFTQATENDVKDLKNLDEQKNVPSNKPKIRSIVILDKPVKILNLHKGSDNSALKERELNSIKDLEKPECSNAHAQVDNRKPLSNSGNVRTNTEGAKVFNEKDVARLPVPAVEDKNTKKILESKGKVNANVSKECFKHTRGKENERLMLKKGISSNPKKGEAGFSKSIMHQKTKSMHTGIKKSNDNIATVAPKRTVYTKTAVMPCLKHASRVKSKTSPVKKVVLRNITGCKIKPSIGPGFPRKKQDDVHIETKENLYEGQEICGKKFAQPEYNSIILTINKLNEVQKKNIITDTEHLPSAYKNLFNDKISSALDFPLNEAIYKNLVELSIDEKQLPSRLTRTKDPEPRQRDIDPILSDFFTPISTEEYCSAISVKPRTPEIQESWSAFSVSEKIFEWKRNVDHI